MSALGVAYAGSVTALTWVASPDPTHSPDSNQAGLPDFLNPMPTAPDEAAEPPGNQRFFLPLIAAGGS